ncbi:hypothetical protein ABT68_00765 [Salmonella enterica subsp. enterica serovar Typhimurium]|nr:hypothetical protein ABT68_00765 [Salmonella enterica subsp. enterica serovar Typhimurium]
MKMKLTDKPLSFERRGQSFILRPKSKNPPAYTDGFYEVKLTDKPLSFGYSVVDSHSSCRPVKAKTRQLTLTGFMKR